MQHSGGSGPSRVVDDDADVQAGSRVAPAFDATAQVQGFGFLSSPWDNERQEKEKKQKAEKENEKKEKAEKEKELMEQEDRLRAALATHGDRLRAALATHGGCGAAGGGGDVLARPVNVQIKQYSRPWGRSDQAVRVALGRMKDVVSEPKLWKKSSGVRICHNKLCATPNLSKPDGGKCRKCFDAWYCSGDCQRADWFLHRQECESTDLPACLQVSPLYFPNIDVQKAATLGREKHPEKKRRSRLLEAIDECKTYVDEIALMISSDSIETEESARAHRGMEETLHLIACCYLYLGVEPKARKYMCAARISHATYELLMMECNKERESLFVKGFENLAIFGDLLHFHLLLGPAEKAHESNLREARQVCAELQRAREVKAGVLRLPVAPVYSAPAAAVDANSKKAKKNKAKASQARAHALAAAAEEGALAEQVVSLANAQAELDEASANVLASNSRLALCRADSLAADAHTEALNEALAAIERLRSVSVLEALVEKQYNLCRLSCMAVLELQDGRMKACRVMLPFMNYVDKLWQLWKMNEQFMIDHNLFRDMSSCISDLQLDLAGQVCLTPLKKCRVLDILDLMRLHHKMRLMQRPLHPDNDPLSGLDTLQEPCGYAKCKNPTGNLTVFCGTCGIERYCDETCLKNALESHKGECHAISRVGGMAWLTYGQDRGTILNFREDHKRTAQHFLEWLKVIKSEKTEEMAWKSSVESDPMAETQHEWNLLRLEVMLMVAHLHLGVPHIAYQIMLLCGEKLSNFCDVMRRIDDIHDTAPNPSDKQFARLLLDKFDPKQRQVCAVLDGANDDVLWQMRETSIARLQYTLHHSKSHCHNVMFRELVKQMKRQIEATVKCGMFFRYFYAEYNLYSAVRKFWAENKKAHEDIAFKDMRCDFLRTKEMYAPMLEVMRQCKAQKKCNIYKDLLETIFADMEVKLKLFQTGNPLPESVPWLRLPPT